MRYGERDGLMRDSDDGLDFFGGDAPRRRRRWVRVLPSIVCLLGAVFLMAMIGNADVDQGNLWAIPALALAITAATLPVWWRGGSGDPLEGQARRVLRLHWRLHLRASILLGYVSLVFLWIASYAHFEYTDEYDTTNPVTDGAHYDSYSTLSLWFLVAAAIPVAVSPLTWRLWPRSVRMAVRESRAAARAMMRNRNTLGYPRDLDQ
jgi:membrane protease YdiL (CAAX protease family)